MVLEISQYVSVREAVTHALSELNQPVAETIPTRESCGRIAAEDVKCDADLPPHSTSHMDGFAIRAEDTRGAARERPARLTLVDSIPLGAQPSHHLGIGEAARVATGSVLPAGADSVVPVEDGQAGSGVLLVPYEVSPGAFVFGAGEDVRKGKVVLRKGEAIRPQDLGMLVALGVAEVKVWKRPRIALLATGSELTNSATPEANKVRNSHAPVFLAMAAALGCDAIDLGIAPDKVGVILSRVKQALRKSDIVLTTGGTSVGRMDLADQVMAKIRPKVLYHGIKMDRGRVAGVGVAGGKGIVLMPGPIQGALNAFFLLGLPMVGKLSGRQSSGMTINASLTRRWEARKKFPHFTKVVYLRVFQSRGKTAAEPLAAETESMSLLTDSNAYMVVPEDVTSLEAGREVQAHLIPGVYPG